MRRVGVLWSSEFVHFGHVSRDVGWLGESPRPRYYSYIYSYWPGGNQLVPGRMVRVSRLCLALRPVVATSGEGPPEVEGLGLAYA